MPKDTHDNNMSLYREGILALLRLADERMLHESGNPVYLRLKAELDQLKSAQPRDLSDSPSIGNGSFRFQDHPVLGVRIGFGGARLIYRTKRPENQLPASDHPQLETDKSTLAVDADMTLVDINPDTKSSDSK